MIREVTGVGDEGQEVENEGHEQTVENRSVVALPHEVNKDTDLRGRKNLIIFRSC